MWSTRCRYYRFYSGGERVKEMARTGIFPETTVSCIIYPVVGGTTGSVKIHVTCYFLWNIYKIAAFILSMVQY